MKRKTYGTILLVCGILCVAADALLVILDLVLKHNSGSKLGLITNIISLVVGICFCYLGIEMKKQDK